MKFFKANIALSGEFVSPKDNPNISFNKDTFQSVILFDGIKQDLESDKVNITTYLITTNIRLNTFGAEQLFQEACKTWGAEEVTNIDTAETSFNKIANGCWLGGVADFDSIVGMFDLFEFRNLLNHEDIFFENTSISALNKSQALKIASSSPYSQTLSEEIVRIYRQTHASDEQQPSMLPVHYVLEGNKPSKYQPALKVLIGALKKCGRVSTHHVYHLNIDRFGRLSLDNAHVNSRFGGVELLNEKFAEAIKGSTVILEYGRFDKDGSFRKNAYAALVSFLNLMKDYRDNTQLIFIIPPGKTELKQRIARRFDFPLVEICEDAKPHAQSLSLRQAVAYLKKKASADNIEIDDTLKGMLNERLRDKSFQDLDQLYCDWQLEQLLHTKYPLYLDTAKRLKTLRLNHQAVTSA